MGTFRTCILFSLWIAPSAFGQVPAISTFPDWGIGMLILFLIAASLHSFRRAGMTRRWPDDATRSSGRRPRAGSKPYF